MTTFFAKINIFFIVKIILVIVVSLSYYLLVTLMKIKHKNDYLFFDNINSSIIGVYKDSFDIFLRLKRELDLYERNLLNCKTMGNTMYKIEIPNINSIETPKLGNLIMKITRYSSFDKDTLDRFNLLYSNNACESLFDSSSDMNYCKIFWSGVLLKGMEQSITQMGVVIGTVLDELASLNDLNNTKMLYNLLDHSSYIIYEQFIEYYLLKSYNETNYIFRDLREETINSIIKVMRYISIGLFVFLTIFIYNSKNTLNSFMNFIGILPSHYLSEDENLFNEIIKFGNNYF